MGTHDPAKRRKAQRRGREKGCWVYLSAEQLMAVGFRDSETAPWYRVWEDRAHRRPRFVVNLYREP